MSAAIDAVYRRESRRVLATLIRLLCDFDLAEEAMHEAFAAAVVRWPETGTPENPHASSPPRLLAASDGDADV